MTYQTDQEAFWAGEFGRDYIARNQGDALLAANLAFFTQALRAAGKVDSCMEFGANIGMNLRALKLLYPQQRQGAVEINAEAARQLRAGLPGTQVHEESILDVQVPGGWDLVLIKTVLIHINPEFLPQVYDRLHAASSRLVLVAEYYNPAPVTITYRGHEQRLFKRDFAGEMLERFPDLRLVDYGFNYRNDPAYPQDDITWFLLEKRP
jgi:pseudaminic acid biosynthesis-associated methylase